MSPELMWNLFDIFYMVLLTDGLKENPLYVTSAEASNTEIGPVYGVVNKQKQQKGNIPFVENKDQGPVYSQVQKCNKKGSFSIVLSVR